MLGSYIRTLYQRILSESYELAFGEIAKVLADGGNCLDCGANTGRCFDIVNRSVNLILRQFHSMAGFSEAQGYGFLLYPYPLPTFMRPVLERIDLYHCHQMVFTAKKPSR